jgi:enoyl-CoA hydratase/carnithine racemase
VRGEEALKLGFVSEVAPDASRAHEASLRWAKRAAAGGPAATSALLATLRQKQVRVKKRKLCVHENAYLYEWKYKKRPQNDEKHINAI